MLGRPRSLGRGASPETHGPRPRRAGPLGRSGGIRGSGAPGQRHAVRHRPADPARSRSRRGRSAERPRDHLAEAAAPAGARPLRGMGLPDPRPRLLRGGSAQPAMGIDRSRPPDRSGERRGRHPDRSPIATSWSRRSAGFRSTSARSSSSTTTWACPSWRWPRRSASRTGPRDRASTTQPARCAPPSMRSRSADRLREGRLA